MLGYLEIRLMYMYMLGRSVLVQGHLEIILEICCVRSDII